LKTTIHESFPGSRVLAVSDLQKDDQEFFKKEHGDDCPGMVKLDFYGIGKPTIALALVKRTGGTTETIFVVASRSSQWELKKIDLIVGNPAVLWALEPGEYTDVYGNKTIRAPYPVVVFCKYEAYAVLYSWTGKKIQKIWIAD